MTTETTNQSHKDLLESTVTNVVNEAVSMIQPVLKNELQELENMEFKTANSLETIFERLEQGLNVARGMVSAARAVEDRLTDEYPAT